MNRWRYVVVFLFVRSFVRSFVCLRRLQHTFSHTLPAFQNNLPVITNFNVSDCFSTHFPRTQCTKSLYHREIPPRPMIKSATSG